MNFREWECNKIAFLKNWPGGYEENFDVYTPTAGLTEQEIVDTCLRPFYNSGGVALEVGCGKGFWVHKYLLPNFVFTYGKDVIPREWVKPDTKAFGFAYLEGGEQDYALDLPDEHIDFVWSFGLFCHLSLESVAKYLREIYRVLKAGKHASLYFSNKDKCPLEVGGNQEPDPDEVVGWTENDWPTTLAMLKDAGFSEIREVLSHGKDTMSISKK